MSQEGGEQSPQRTGRVKPKTCAVCVQGQAALCGLASPGLPGPSSSLHCPWLPSLSVCFSQSFSLVYISVSEMSLLELLKF